jgi:translation initiation factor 2 beta subunit (eIF-2beta)/eIF-5
MLMIGDRDGLVRFECEACGAQQTMRRFTSRPSSGRTRCEPEEGQWLHCGACGDWSPLHRTRDERVAAVGR